MTTSFGCKIQQGYGPGQYEKLCNKSKTLEMKTYLMVWFEYYFTRAFYDSNFSAGHVLISNLY